MSRTATILHADLDAFYASVEQRDDPLLRGRPVAVGPGIVLAASYEARAHGVRSAMPAWKARSLCPSLRIVPARFEAYVQASREVFALFAEASPVVERLSIDEAFLDARGLDHISGSPGALARRLRADVRRELGLPLSVGVATTKHLAKVASGAAKPDGVLVLEPEGELAFLHGLAVERISGIGPATTAALHELGIRTVGELAARGEHDLVRALGRARGRGLHAVAHNRDPRPVRSGRGRRSVGSQSALGRRRRSPEELDTIVVALVDRVARRLRAGGRTGRTITLRMRLGDHTRATRSRTLPRATASTETILAVARALLAAESALVRERGLTLVGVALTNLETADRQLELPLAGPGAALDGVVDAVRDRFGTGALRRAALLEGGAERDPWLGPQED